MNCNIFRCNKLLILPILTLLFFTISSCVAHIAAIQIIGFVSTQIFCVFLPGLAAYKVSGIKENCSVITFFASYLLGYGISTMLYVICLCSGIQDYVLLPIILVSICSVYYLLRRKAWKDITCDSSKDIKLLCAILGLSYVIGLTGYQMRNPSAGITGYTYINPDCMFWMRNSVACSMQFPVNDLSVMGKNIFYHYFSSMHIALLHGISGIEYFNLCFSFTPIIITLLTVGGGYILCNELFNNLKTKYLALFAILFTSNIENVTYIGYADHIYTGSFGFAEGLGYAFFVLYILLRLLKYEGINYQLLITCMFSIMLLTGLKSPLALVVLTGLGSVCFYMLFKRRTVYKAFVIGIPSLFSFFLIFLIFILNVDSFGFQSDSRVPLFSINSVCISPILRNVHSHIIGMFSSEIIGNVCSLIIYFILIAFFPISLQCIVLYKKVFKCPAFISLLFISGIIGLLMGTFLKHEGNSQCYYWFIGYPCLLLSLLYIIDSHRLLKVKWIDNLVYSLTFIGFLFMASSVISPCGSGILKFAGLFPKEKKNDGISVTTKELEGLKWVRDNTPKNAIVASNKIFADQGFRSFILSSYTERQTFIEGYDYSGNIKDVKNERVGLLESSLSGHYDALRELKEKGLNYLIIFKTIEKGSSSAFDSNVVYENEELKVCKL